MKMSAMKLKKTLIYLFLAVFTFVQIFPFYWLVTFSFKSNTEIFDSNNLVGLPKVWHFGNYSKALWRRNLTISVELCFLCSSDSCCFNTSGIHGCICD